jgi:hypothetical protein
VTDSRPGPTRRTFLLGGSALGLALVLPLPHPASAQQTSGLFLTEAELRTLRAVVARFVPGPPGDADPGALEAGCAEGIDALLAAFTVDPPLVYAGAPFSDRGGAPRNDFADFRPLDPYEELAWRLRIEGSRGRPELERNGPVTGLQAVYREGLAALDAVSAPATFADLPAPAQDLALRSDDPAVEALVDVGFPQTLELLYGPPEYGGNRDLVGWSYTTYDGDVQPRGYTRAEIETHSPRDGTAAPLPLPMEQLVALAPLATHETASGLLAAGDGSLRALRDGVTRLLEGGSRAR